MTANFAILELASHYPSSSCSTSGGWAATRSARLRDHGRSRRGCWRVRASASARWLRQCPRQRVAARRRRRPAGGAEPERRGRGDARRRRGRRLGVGAALARAENAQVEAVFKDPARRDRAPMSCRCRNRIRSARSVLARCRRPSSKCTRHRAVHGERQTLRRQLLRDLVRAAFRPHVIDMFEHSGTRTDLGKDGEPVVLRQRGLDARCRWTWNSNACWTRSRARSSRSTR